MTSKVQDINRESTLNRVLRENALAALIVSLTLISLINGIIMGMGITTMNTNTIATNSLRTAYEVNYIYTGNLDAWIRAQGLTPPDSPPPYLEEQ